MENQQPLDVESKSVLPNRPKRIVLLLIGIVVLMAMAGSTYALYRFQFILPGWLEKSLPLGGGDIDVVYETYCSDNLPPLLPVTAGINVQTAHYDDIKTAIDNAFQNGEVEKIGLINQKLFSLLNNMATTTLLEDVYYDSHNQLLNKGLRDRAIFLQKRFFAFQQGNHTPTFYEVPVKIDETYYYMTNTDQAYWRLFYALETDPWYATLSQQQQNNVAGAVLVFLAQISFLQEQIATDTALLKKEWEEVTLPIVDSTSTPTQLILSDLHDKKVKDQNIGITLETVGFRQITENNDLDEGFRFLRCAAERYYDGQAMYRLAQIYGEGSDGMKDILPNLKATIPLTPNIEKRYFWVVSLLTLDQIRLGIYSTADTQTGWNTVAMLDTIQNTGVLKSTEIEQVEREASAFLVKRYPEIGPSGYESGTHSMGSMIDALEKAGGTQYQMTKQGKDGLEIPTPKPTNGQFLKLRLQ